MKRINKNILSLILLVVGVLLLIIGIYFSTKFKSISIEIGNAIKPEEFVVYGTSQNISLDLAKVNVNQIGQYPVRLHYLFIDYDLYVDIVDTTAPLLEVQDVYKPLNYLIDVSDFVVNVQDASEYKVSYQSVADTTKYGDYSVTIIAEDIHHNKVTKVSSLSIGWIKKEYTIEIGNTINLSDLLYDVKDKDTINQQDLDNINKQGVGTYYIKSIKNGNEINVKIEKTKDITPPTLTLKSVTIYEGKKIKSIDDFIVEAKDKVSDVTLKLLTNIDYSKIGEQNIQIEATDKENNKIVKDTTLKIINDTIGPIISGLSKITINKGSSIDYLKGVSAYDENYGSCNFSVDSSGVNNTKYGTYYAIYTASDKLGNKTTSKRVIVVNHDSTDTNNLVNSIAKTLSTSAEAIRDYVRNNIAYNTNSGGNDPIWYGLKNKVGNCIVHAYIFDVLLRNKGYTTKIIWTTDKTHYWNMVYLNGKWVHMDSTPSSRHNKYSIMNDAQRYERLQGRDWDRSLWPKAE